MTFIKYKNWYSLRLLENFLVNLEQLGCGIDFCNEKINLNQNYFQLKLNINWGMLVKYMQDFENNIKSKIPH